MRFSNANVTLMVGDLNRALSFYEDTLGFTLQARHDGFFAELRAAGLTIVLHPRRPGVTARASHVSLGMRVESLAETAAHLRAAGVPFEEQKNDANEFLFFRDPDGTALYVIRERV